MPTCAGVEALNDESRAPLPRGGGGGGTGPLFRAGGGGGPDGVLCPVKGGGTPNLVVCGEGLGLSSDSFGARGGGGGPALDDVLFLAGVGGPLLT